MFAFDTPIVTGTDTFDTQKGGTALDLLNRKAFGKRLSDLMGRGDPPLVVALDGGWGAGKSHFLKLWTGSHQGFGGKARVVYFDAFERDYLDDPLISLVAAISRNPNEGDATPPSQAIIKLKSVAVKLIRPTLRIGLAAATAGVSEGVVAAWDEVFDKSVEALGDEAKAAIDTLWQREEGRIAAVEGFRTALAELAKEQPLILVIDELDRCRPDYALSLLEVVKHFFSVPGVRFVLGVNLQALGHSVQQRYGAGVDGVLYLQKFVHLTVGLPRLPNGEAWEGYFLPLCQRLNVPERVHDDARDILTLFRQRPVTLRDVERIASRLAMLPQEFKRFPGGFTLTLLTAITLETLHRTAYEHLRAGRLSMPEITELFGLLSATEDGNRMALNLLHIWSAALQDQPSPETVARTQNAFGNFARGKPNIEYYFREILDTFAPPPAR